MAITLTNKHWLVTALLFVAQVLGIFAITPKVLGSPGGSFYRVPIAAIDPTNDLLWVKVGGFVEWATLVGWLAGSSLLTAVIILRLLDVVRAHK